MKRIFVRGLSRSGGTLMATILDAHPQIAMSYELYQHLLKPESGEGDAGDDFAAYLKKCESRTGVFRWPSFGGKDHALFKRFVARAQRSGIEPDELARTFDEHRAEGMGLGTLRERTLFIERICQRKMQREGKQSWGMKIASGYQDIHEIFPDAYFLYMLRDGRDTAASRKLVGDFNQSVEQIAESWVKQLHLFQQFSRQPGVNAQIVHYEQLVRDPETSVREIIDFLGLPWSDAILRYYEQDLSIYRNSTGHLSADQVNKPVGTASVGRWKADLTAEEIERFERIAGDSLHAAGYELSGREPAAT